MYTRTFSTLGCADLELEGVVALGARHGISHFELRALGGTTELVEYFQARGTPAKLAESLQAVGAQLVALDTSFRLIGNTDEDRRKLVEFLPWAEAAGVRWLRVFDGGTALSDESLSQAAETLNWWQRERQARASAVNLMIETHDVLLTADTISQFGRAMPKESVRLLWDTHHTWRKGGEDPVVTWTAVHEHVVHVHVKDSVSQPTARHPFTYVLPGTGEFPMSPIQSVLARDFVGPVSLEWERLWHPYLPPLDDALRAAGEHRWW